MHLLSSRQAIDDVLHSTGVNGINLDENTVPTTMKEAFYKFFFTGDRGPLCVVISILSFTVARSQIPSFGVADALVFGGTILFWSFQEHFLHEKVLHSKVDWVGKEIHQTHHQRPYYHISVDPAPLLLGWMFTAHLVFRSLLPYHLALTATIAYSLSGMFYEWAHYIVHTKVRFRSKFWKRVKENHLRHHVVCDEFWFAFSMPIMDDLFGTNPSVRQVKRQMDEKKRQEVTSAS